jgi:putative transposase
MVKDYRAAFYPNKYYHVFNHGVGKEQLFLNVDNYHYFLHLFSKHLGPVADMLCYCLLPNHFHFFIATKTEQIIADYIERRKNNNASAETSTPVFLLQQFGNFFNAYTKAFNKQQGRIGRLFLEPFSRRLIETPTYYTKLVHYIHANPVHHGFCRQVADWPFTSYQQIICRNTWLKHEEVLDWFGSVTSFIEFHQQPIFRKF